jgi:hypothetical protein
MKMSKWISYITTMLMLLSIAIIGQPGIQGQQLSPMEAYELPFQH